MKPLRIIIVLSTFMLVDINHEFLIANYSYASTIYEESKETKPQLSRNINQAKPSNLKPQNVRPNDTISKQKSHINSHIKSPNSKTNINNTKKITGTTSNTKNVNKTIEDKKPLRLEMGKSLILQFSTPPTQVIIGDALIANIIALEKEKRVIVTALNYGSTNLVVFGEDGNTLLDTEVITFKDDKNTVRVYKPDQINTLYCSPRCHLEKHKSSE